MTQGLQTALERIAREAEEKTGKLDLRALGLTEIPSGVFDLTHLTALDLGYRYKGDINQIREVPGAISNLSGLETLTLSHNPINTLESLKSLTALQTLRCNSTAVTDLSPLSGLTELQTLECNSTDVTVLSPLAGLAALQSLGCDSTAVTDLSPLSGLTALQTLGCNSTSVSDLTPLKTCLQNQLTRLFLRNCPVTDVPPEILTGDCGSSLKAHFDDLGESPQKLNQFKILILGNGRVGKTQIARALQGLDMITEDVSTHAINTIRYDIFDDDSLPQARIWDFGGQDIYHGTHALFMRGRAVNLLAWNRISENTPYHEYKGQRFKNEKLPYWVEFIRRLSGYDNPLILTQTQCEDHGALKPPIEPELLEPFDFKPVVSFDADTKTGLMDLIDYLRIAQRKIPQPLIGAGRLAVKDALLEMKVETPKKKLLPFAEFETLCQKTGGISNPHLFAQYLHHADVVFYRKSLFDDNLILDSNWMFDAIYAVLTRDGCKLEIERSDGRFTLGDLGRWLWDEKHSHEEQVQFLNMMLAIGICFQISPSYYSRRDNTAERRKVEYIAPELLPAEKPNLDGLWDEDVETTGFDIEFDFLPDPVFRAVMSRLGQEAGLNGKYWKTGLYLFEKRYKSAAQITLSKGEDGFTGVIQVRTQRNDAQGFCEDLTEIIYEVAESYGFAPKTPKTDRRAKISKERMEPATEPEPMKALSFGQAGLSNFSEEIFVSYSWANKAYPDHEVHVDKLCDEAETRGIKIWRDKNDLGIGQSIDVFMNDLSQSRRCFIFLSEKYLKSEFCMYELYHVWRWSRSHPELFHDRVHIFNIDAKIFTIPDRLKIARHWKAQYGNYAALGKADFDVMASETFKLIKNVKEFAMHTDEILTHIARTVQPKDFEDFLKNGFSDL